MQDGLRGFRRAVYRVACVHSGVSSIEVGLAWLASFTAWLFGFGLLFPMVWLGLADLASARGGGRQPPPPSAPLSFVGC